MQNQIREWIPVTEQGEFPLLLDLLSFFRLSLSDSVTFSRTNTLTGFQTAMSHWGGYSQSERRIKVSKALALK